ncbi:hypothetical protein F4859DRAFT_338042 [Xylaria cf. heliscus]|nr:hypothetical protein F4859DRAFT_338042 [Xylaria cf. heliscus]
MRTYENPSRAQSLNIETPNTDWIGPLLGAMHVFPVYGTHQLCVFSWPLDRSCPQDPLSRVWIPGEINVLYASHIAASPRVLLLVYPLATKQCKGIDKREKISYMFPAVVGQPGIQTKVKNDDDDDDDNDSGNNKYNNYKPGSAGMCLVPYSICMSPAVIMLTYVVYTGHLVGAGTNSKGSFGKEPEFCHVSIRTIPTSTGLKHLFELS